MSSAVNRNEMWAKYGVANWRANIVRHLLMRIALGFVIGWFGFQQIRKPAEWIYFIPAIVSDHSAVADTDLILAHGFLLMLAASGVLFGIVFMGACFLAAALLGEIILSLFLVGDSANQIVRDSGLLGLAIALALDPIRFWHLELASWHRLSPIRQYSNSGEHPPSLGWGALWRVRAVGMTFLAATMLALALFLPR